MGGAVLAAESTSLREYAARVQSHLIAVAEHLSILSRQQYGHMTLGCRLPTDPRMNEAVRRGIWG